jgi:hypothetical protein
MPFFQVVPQERVASAHMNTALSQGVLRFGSAAERTAQVVSPVAGMLSFLADSGRYEMWTGTAWRPVVVAEAVAGATLNPAWTGTAQATRVGGMTWVYLVVSAANALPNTWYDIGTFPVGFRPYGTVTGLPAYCSGVAGRLEFQAGGLLRVNPGPKHTAGPAEVSAAFSVPYTVPVP